MSSPKITVHWLNNSRAQRILWVLEELSLPYEIKRYTRTEKNLAPPELKQVHALGKSPVVTIAENGETITLAESGAIVEFLLERYGGGKFVVPPTGDLKQRAEYLYWLHFAEGTAMGPLILHMIFTIMPKESPFFIRPIVSVISSAVLKTFVGPNLKTNFKFCEDHFKTSSGDYFVGDEITGADFMMVFPIEGLEAGFGFDNFPLLGAWFKRVSQRPAYILAEEKGGKNDFSAFTK